MTQTNITGRFNLLLKIAALMLCLVPSMALAGERAVKTTANVYWLWDTENPVGTAKLIRTSSGITAVFQTSDLPPGHAVTLWVTFFNNPEACSTSPCSVPEDVFNPDASADFHFGGGSVTGGTGKVTLAGHLNTGDISGSGKVEAELAEGVPLTNPFEAEVVLALHSHGPKLTGTDLRSQLSSFLGGCEVFLGPDGLGAGPGDVPAEIGECSTIQFSLHEAPE